MNPFLRRVFAALAVVLVLAVSGCGGTPSENRKQGTGEVRTDVAPLTERWPALGEPVSATWMSGTRGSSRAPGPSTYWIDAVVRLRPAVADRLRGVPTSAGERPDLLAPVAAKVPRGDLLTSHALDRRFSQGSFGARVFLVDGTDTLVLEALGGS